MLLVKIAQQIHRYFIKIRKRKDKRSISLHFLQKWRRNRPLTVFGETFWRIIPQNVMQLAFLFLNNW